MDTSEYPSLPNLAQMHVRLAANSRRVQEVVDGQLCSLERLLKATANENWPLVKEVSHFLAHLPPKGEDGSLVLTARQVYEELQQGVPGPHGPVHLAKLLAECRAAQRRRMGN
jgi:hypothetical protein